MEMDTKKALDGHLKDTPLNREEFDQVISILVDKYEVEKVILFGSFVTGNYLQESDLDLAVEGIAEEDYFKALGDLMCNVSRGVDLVDLSAAKVTLRRRIAREGLVVYER